MESLKDLYLVKCINENTSHKTSALLCSTTPKNITEGSVLDFATKQLADNPNSLAIVLLERTIFSESEFQPILSSENISLIGTNDIYHRLLVNTPSDSKVTIIRPCTITHVKKYLASAMRMVKETALDFETKIVPFIQSIPPERTKWINDIIKGEAEQGDILHRDDLLVIIPDSKWDRKTLNSLYLLAISIDSNIRCIRDLRADHIPLLLHMKSMIYNVAKGHFGVEHDQLRLYIHYHPSYYHFHIHVVYVQMDSATGMMIGQCHLLDDVIELLKMKSLAFSTRTMFYAISEAHPIFQALRINQ